MDSDDNDKPFRLRRIPADMPSHAVLEMLASKWVYLVRVCVAPRPASAWRTGPQDEGITPKMLTQTLRNSSATGGERKIYPVIPPGSNTN